MDLCGHCKLFGDSCIWVELLVQMRLYPIFMRWCRGLPDIHECSVVLTGCQRTPNVLGRHKLHRFLLTTFPPAQKAASDAIVLTGTVNTSRAIIDNTRYLICCFFHHSKISKSSLVFKWNCFYTKIFIYILLYYLDELVVAFFLL